MARFSIHEQISRLVCVEGWSAIAWWAGLRFDDLRRAYHLRRRRSGCGSSRRSISIFPEIPTPTCLNRPGDGPPSTNAAPHAFQRSAPECGPWSAAPSTRARNTWFEECEGHLPRLRILRKSQRTTGPNLDIPATTVSNIQGSYMNTKLKQETREDTRPTSAEQRLQELGVGLPAPPVLTPLRRCYKMSSEKKRTLVVLCTALQAFRSPRRATGRLHWES
jgi:hypothetical protein